MFFTRQLLRSPSVCFLPKRDEFHSQLPTVEAAVAADVIDRLSQPRLNRTASIAILYIRGVPNAKKIGMN